MRSKIFISYRREDSSAYAGWLYDTLKKRFPEEQLFKDIDSIPLGRDFKVFIENKVNECIIIVVVIGKEFTKVTDDKGVARISKKDDFVHIELSKALRAKKIIIPVLVDNAQMPSIDELPTNLRKLPFLNGMSLRPESWNRDSQKLIEELSKIINEKEQKEEDKLKLKQEEERKAKEEAEQKRKQEEERKAKEEAEQKRKQEEERKAKEEAELKRKEEAERKRKEEDGWTDWWTEEDELKHKKEAERKRKREAELKRKEEAERKPKEEAKLKQREEELERKALEEKWRKEQEEIPKRLFVEKELRLEIGYFGEVKKELSLIVQKFSPSERNILCEVLISYGKHRSISTNLVTQNEIIVNSVINKTIEINSIDMALRQFREKHFIISNLEKYIRDCLLE